MGMSDPDWFRCCIKGCTDPVVCCWEGRTMIYRLCDRHYRELQESRRLATVSAALMVAGCTDELRKTGHCARVNWSWPSAPSPTWRRSSPWTLRRLPRIGWRARHPYSTLSDQRGVAVAVGMICRRRRHRDQAGDHRQHAASGQKLTTWRPHDRQRVMTGEIRVGLHDGWAKNRT